MAKRMIKNNGIKTTFFTTGNGVRIYRHDMPHGLTKYSVKQGRNVLHNKQTFAKLDRELQSLIAEEWQKIRMLNVA